MRTISEVESQLRLSLAAPSMKSALELALPLVRERMEELEGAWLFTKCEKARKDADTWLLVALVMASALDDCKPAEYAQGVRLVEFPGRVQ